MTNQDKLQQLFDAALRSIDEPLPKPATVASDKLFAPPPWKLKEASATPTQPVSPHPSKEEA